MSEKIYGSKIVRLVKDRCSPHLNFFKDKQVAIILFEPPKQLKDPQMLAQYVAAVTSTNQKVKTFGFLGCDVNRIQLPADTSSRQLREIIKSTVDNHNNVGIIIQNPIPGRKLKVEIDKIPPQLDIDGINKTSVFKASATSEAISRLVLNFSKPGDRVAVVGSMGFVGGGVIELIKDKNLQLIELDKGKRNTQIDIKQQLLDSNIVVSATGKANLIQPDFLKPEHKLVVDAAFIPQADGTVLGDINKDGYDIPQFITPVPGGVGPTQMAVLLERITKTAKIEIQLWDYQKDILVPKQQQQQRVDKIAPILIDYLLSKKAHKIETDNTFVEYNLETKTLIYKDKKNLSEQLKAQKRDGKWFDLGSSISAEKESYFLHKVAPAISKNATTNSKSKSRKLRR